MGTANNNVLRRAFIKILLKPNTSICMLINSNLAKVRIDLYLFYNWREKCCPFSLFLWKMLNSLKLCRERFSPPWLHDLFCGFPHTFVVFMCSTNPVFFVKVFSQERQLKISLVTCLFLKSMTFLVHLFSWIL